MMITDRLKVSLVVPAGDAVIVEDIGTAQRWIIGMEDVQSVMRLLDNALKERSMGITVTIGNSPGLTQLAVPIDGFVLFASALGYYLGVTWKASESGIKVQSIPEFVYENKLPITLLRADGTAH